jgi:hypothetical protein
LAAGGRSKRTPRTSRRRLKALLKMKIETEIIADKQLRQNIDIQIQMVKDLPPSRERSIAITKLQEAVMWLGMDLKRLGAVNPYPESKNPENQIVEPTADNLKM